MKHERLIWSEPVKVCQFSDLEEITNNESNYIELNAIRTDGVLIELSDMEKAVKTIKMNFINKCINKIEEIQRSKKIHHLDEMSKFLVKERERIE